MCGILAIIGSKNSEKAKKQSRLMSHRGPDESGVYVHEEGKGAVLCHERLSIMDPKHGHQPLQGSSTAWMIHNGEIYNHEELREGLKKKPQRRTTSDSEIIVHLWEEMGTKSVELLDGVFAFVLVDGEKVFAGRDPIGVKPLYYGYDKDGAMWFASETKSLTDVVEELREFPPGTYYTHEEGFVKWYQPSWMTGEAAPTKDASRIRELLTKAVRKRLMTDVPLGVLLSGGLDSSLVTSIVVKELKKKGKTVKSFSVGISKDSVDLKKARAVAEFLGTEHHEIIYSVEEGIAILKDLLHKTESYDVTTTRASTPMYIMSKYIADQGVKVVLSGEGADEIFGGYLYFGLAPTAMDFHDECVRRVGLLNTADLLRADRSTMGAGVEARVPFLDKEFLDEAMLLLPELKQVVPGKFMEKHVLREAFDTPEDPYLPDEVLWRQKEQFSDGVGYSWVDSLKAHADEQVSDEEFAKREELFPHNTPDTKEAFYYRKIHAEHFPHKDSPYLTKKWIPRWQEDKDPSGRASTIHEQSYYPEQEESKKTDQTRTSVKKPVIRASAAS